MLAGGERVVVAVSGGRDSVALLHLLRRLAGPLRLALHVVHVDHRLRDESGRDAEFVRALAGRLGVPAEVVEVDVGPGSVEAAARAARYAALEAVAGRTGATRVAVGHTADDQAETVLMRLLEGSGVRGLAGIPPVRDRIVRPLLEVRRAELEPELLRAGLKWLEDPTNADRRFLRNRLRHEVLPRLGGEGTDVVGALNRVARAARETVDALGALAERELDRLACGEPGALTLPRGALAALPPALGAEVLRQAARRLGARRPLRAWGYRALRRALGAAPPRRPVSLGEVMLEASGDHLRVAVRPVAALAPVTLAVPGRVTLPEARAVLDARLVAAGGYRLPRDPSCVAFDAAGLPRALTVRARRPGDRFHPFGGHEGRLKSFLIDAGVPRWERARLPLVEAAGEIVWVAGLRRGAAAPVGPDTREVVELALSPLARAPSTR